jgi:hypothetical protein
MRATGSIAVGNLMVNEASSGETLLGWKSLATDSVRLSLDPDELRIDEVRLAGLVAKVVVFKDRSLNLAKVFILEQEFLIDQPGDIRQQSSPFVVWHEEHPS